MIPLILAKIETDPSYSLDEAAADISEAFGSPEGIAQNHRFFLQIFNFLKKQPELSRKVFDTLVRLHNASCQKIDEQFTPGCCCCGIDPYEPERQLSIRIEDILARTLSGEFIDLVESYRNSAHLRQESVATLGNNKHSVGAEIFSRLTSKKEIDINEADYIYAVLQRNECVADELIEYAFSGGRFLELAQRESLVKSPVVDRISAAFGAGSGSSFTRPGGGCCCCCCCCCCCGGGC